MWHLYPNETPPDIPEDEDFGVEYDEAMRKLYTSELFEKLQNPEKPRFAAQG